MTTGSDQTGTWAEIGIFLLTAIGMGVAAIMRFSGIERLVENRVSDVKMNVLENFVRRDEFKQYADQMNRNIDTLRAAMESSAKATDAKIDRVDAKIEKARELLDEKLERLLSRSA